MRAVEHYRGIVVSTNLGGGFYFAARGAMVCRLTLGENKGRSIGCFRR
jgi:hypothetical protein